jgi:hypothetical protein
LKLCLPLAAFSPMQPTQVTRSLQQERARERRRGSTSPPGRSAAPATSCGSPPHALPPYCQSNPLAKESVIFVTHARSNSIRAY